MHCVVTLNEKDIQKLIAETYGVPEYDVFVKVETETRGYGIDEHLEQVPEAIVIFEDRYPFGVDQFRVIEEDKNERT